MLSAKRRIDVRVDGTLYRVKNRERVTEGHPVAQAHPELFDHTEPEPPAAEREPVAEQPEPEPEPEPEPSAEPEPDPDPERPSTSVVREWAQENGYEVADKGRVPDSVFEAYESAHAEDE